MTDESSVSPEELRVRQWRFDQLVRAGLDDEDAFLLAGRFDVDVHLVARMLGRGCKPRLVMEILL